MTCVATYNRDGDSINGIESLVAIARTGMPYINAEARQRLGNGGKPETPGELNYAITKVVDEYLIQKGGIRYAHLNEVIGALECAKLELYRRVAAPYEDRKIAEAGDVYSSLLSSE